MALPKYVTKTLTHKCKTWTELQEKISDFQRGTFWASKVDYSYGSNLVAIESTQKLIDKLEKAIC